MKAIAITKYGEPADVLQLQDLPRPTPGDDQVLVRVRAASLNVADLAPIRGVWLARLMGTGLTKPKRTILGSDIAGQVEAVGRNVQQFQPGDAVFGTAPGGLAEYACTRETRLALKPANITFDQAAAVPTAAITALQAICDKGQLQPGQCVLVNGASGGVGTFAVQIARAFGGRVTAVCSAHNLDNARAMGAERVVDYTREDFTRNGQQYDLIVAVNGYHSMASYRRSLRLQGTCVVIGGTMPQIFQALAFGPLLSRRGGQKIGFMGIAQLNQKDLRVLADLLQAGQLKPFVDRRYRFAETLQAVQYVQAGHARGKVVIAVEPNTI